MLSAKEGSGLPFLRALQEEDKDGIDGPCFRPGWGVPGPEHASDSLDTASPLSLSLLEVPAFSVHPQCGAIMLTCRGTPMLGPGAGTGVGAGEPDTHSGPCRWSDASFGRQAFVECLLSMVAVLGAGGGGWGMGDCLGV